MTIDRTAPCEVKLRWVPLSNPERPDPSFDELLLWNPCDGITAAYWDGHSFVDSAIGGKTLELGSFTHWAKPDGPEPSDDISINWRLWQGQRQPMVVVREPTPEELAYLRAHPDRSFPGPEELAAERGHKARDAGGRG